MIEKTANDKALLEQLSAAYGKKKAKTIIKKINEFKVRNPNRAFSFIFDELGGFIVVEKKSNKSEAEEFLDGLESGE